MTISAVPTRTTGSLGPTKVNRRGVSDPYRQIDAAEYNLLADCAIHLVNQVGTESSPDWDSLQGIVNSGDTFQMFEPFIRTAATENIWTSATADPTYLTTPKAGIRFTLDAIKDYETNGYWFTRAQTPYTRARIELDGNPDQWLFGFVDSTANEGWGVAVETGGTKIRGYTMTGGVKTYTDVSTWAVSTQFILETALSSSFHLLVAKNGATAVDCGVVPTGNMKMRMVSTAGGAAGKFLDFRQLLVRANWSV